MDDYQFMGSWFNDGQNDHSHRDPDGKTSTDSNETLILSDHESVKSDETVEYDVDMTMAPILKVDVQSNPEIVISSDDEDISEFVTGYSRPTFEPSADNLRAKIGGESEPATASNAHDGPPLKKRKNELDLPCDVGTDRLSDSEQFSDTNSMPRLPSSQAIPSNDLPVAKTKKPALTKEEKEQKKLEREKLKEEKRLEKERDKKLKASLAAQRKNLKPEEAIKSITVHIDVNVINCFAGTQLIRTLDEEGIKYKVDSLQQLSTIFWTKVIKQAVLNENDEFEVQESVREENELLKIVTWLEMVNLIDKGELVRAVQGWKGARHKRLILVIVGMEKYWAYKKNKVNRSMKAALTASQSSRIRKEEAEFESAPVVTPDQMEMALAEVQLVTNTSHRNVEKPEDLSEIVQQLSKAISQIELKRGQYSKEKDSLSWFAKADGKDCVKVDKNGNGLKELWQRQICQFQSIGLEVAQAIVCEYGSPRAVLSAYARCSDTSSAADLLADIAVRREAGILSSTRRVGPELSRKIHRFLTERDPNLPV